MPALKGLFNETHLASSDTASVYQAKSFFLQKVVFGDG